MSEELKSIALRAFGLVVIFTSIVIAGFAAFVSGALFSDSPAWVGAIGFIVEGDDKGEHVLIEQVAPGSKDYYIFVGPATNPKHDPNGGDYWVENEEKLKQFFEESKWRIQWAK